MTEEEKESIEQLKSWREYIIKHKETINKANDIEFYLRTAINLIQKQDTEINKLNNVIDKATKYIEEITGNCPYDTFDCQVRDCENECKNQMAECWKEYFMKEDK